MPKPELETDPTILGKTCFEGYREDMGGETFDGRPIPEWDDLGDKVRSGWIAGAQKVIDLRVDYGPQRWHTDSTP